MLDSLLLALTLLAALGSGLAGGVFFAFSSFVMGALARLPPARGIAVMQAINAVAVTPAFMTALFGTALVCAGLVIAALLAWSEPGAFWLLAGSLVYLVGDIVVTIACNVPLNNRLAAADPESGEGQLLWREYLSRWTAWNHVRTAAGLAASAAFILALTSG